MALSYSVTQGHQQYSRKFCKTILSIYDFKGMDDSGILPLACIPAIHGGHAAVERAMDGLAKSRYHEAKRPSERQQTDQIASTSFPYLGGERSRAND